MKKLPEPAEDGTYTDKDRERIRKFVKNSTMWHLARADQTEQMIRDRLRQKQVPEEFIDEIIQTVTEEGYLNDAQFAKDFISAQREYSQAGPNSIRMKLLQKGVDKDIIDEALEEYETEHEENSYEDSAREIANRKYQQTVGKTTPEKLKQRMLNQLIYKGYPFSVAMAVVCEVIENEGQENS